MRGRAVLAAATWAIMAVVHGAAAQEGEAPKAGTYWADPAHTRLLVDVDHLSFSRYLFFIRHLQAELQFDPDAPETMRVTATVDMGSAMTLDGASEYDFDAIVKAPEFLDAAAHPEAAFTSTAVKLTGDREADVTGDLTFRGVTRPVTLRVRYNGGYGGHPMDAGGARIGFSAEGTINRSDFGMTAGIPAPGTTLGVANAVHLRIETEFLSVKPPAP
jgi:polyisoprenoid-binding protein YceI